MDSGGLLNANHSPVPIFFYVGVILKIIWRPKAFPSWTSLYSSHPTVDPLDCADPFSIRRRARDADVLIAV